MVSYLIFSTSYSKAENENTIACLRKLPSTKIKKETMKHLIFSAWFQQQDEFHRKIEEMTLGTKQVSPKDLFVCKKARRNFLQ